MSKTSPITPLVKDDTRTLLESAVANELVHLLNKLATARIQFSDRGSSRIDVTEDGATIVVAISDVTARRFQNRNNFAQAAGTATRTAFTTSSVSTAQLAERVKAIIDDLYY